MSTHAHFSGEFGSQRVTKRLAKDPAYRAARATHFAAEARRAADAHRGATSASEKARHALVAAHAEKRARVHARAAEKMTPGSHHARVAKAAHEEASRHASTISTKRSEKRGATRDMESPKTEQVEKKSGDELSSSRAKEHAADSLRFASQLDHKLGKLAERAKYLSDKAHESKNLRDHKMAQTAHNRVTAKLQKLSQHARDERHRGVGLHSTHAAIYHNTVIAANRMRNPTRRDLAGLVQSAAHRVSHSDDQHVTSKRLYDELHTHERDKFGSLQEFEKKLKSLRRSLLDSKLRVRGKR